MALREAAPLPPLPAHPWCMPSWPPDPGPQPVGGAVTPAEFARLLPIPATHVATGCSGGPHSLALTLLADQWARARGGAALALIVDHGLRPESAAEAAQVAALLRGRGIASQILSLGLPVGARLQERARDARRAALLAACAAAGIPWLLLGHHRGDQAETLLFRALRGSGPAGLAGMAAVTAAPGALVLRPLLALPPARLEATLAALGLAPLRDPSNRDPRFARIRLRQVLADPDGTGPATAALAAAAVAFASRRARQQAGIARRLGEAATPHPLGPVRLDRAALGRDRLAEATLALLLRQVAGAPHAPAGAAVARLLAAGQGSLHGVLWFGPWLFREPAALAPPVPAEAGAVWDRRWRLLAASPGGMLGALGAESGAFRQPGLPLAALAGLPALRRDGRLLGVPALENGGCVAI